MNKFKKFGIFVGLMFLLVLLATCQKKHDEFEIAFPKTRSYSMINDSTFTAQTEFDNGKIVSRTYRHNPGEQFQAFKKIQFADIYAGLNWAAQKEYHEELLPIRTDLIDSKVTWQN